MPQLIEVAFKGNRKDFFLWEADEAPPLRAPIIVDADRGEDLGVVHACGELAEKRNAGTPHGYGVARPTHTARRLATPEEAKRGAELRAQDEDTRRRAMERVKANDLVMKLTDAEWQWDRKKLTLYFTAERRVDFRTLVRELASMFRTRIELKQIGVRDEARRLDGIGRCGRQYCSSSWLPELRPVNLGVAKDQRLSLNPSQISGACGRLMCCLRYEHEFYVQSRKRFPKEGRIVRTSVGEEKIVSNDIFRDRVTVRGPEGEQRIVPLQTLRDEMAAVGGALPAIANAEPESGPTEAESYAAGEELVLESLAARERKEPANRERRGSAPRERRESPVSARPQTPRRERRGATPAVEQAPAAAAPVADSADTPNDADAQKRPHRRRGRRGGRRNRPSGGTN
jgi:cell fate regulator YaaT (PSP1 superfamily)